MNFDLKYIINTKLDNFINLLKKQPLDEMGDNLFSKGQYKDKTFKEVLILDPKYCVTIIYNYSLLKETDEYKFRIYLKRVLEDEEHNYATEIYKLLVEENQKLLDTICKNNNTIEKYSKLSYIINCCTFTDGLYKGRLFEEILKWDLEYCAWVLSRDRKNDWPELYLFYIYLQHQI